MGFNTPLTDIHQERIDNAESIQAGSVRVKRVSLFDSSGNGLGLGLNIPTYDFVSMALSAGDTTETYTFKTGGSGGTTVATVIIVYTTSTRTILSTVTKS